MQNLISLLGIFALLGIAWALSNNRRLFPWRAALWGIGLQFTLALLLLKTPWGQSVFAGARTLTRSGPSGRSLISSVRLPGRTETRILTSGLVPSVLEPGLVAVEEFGSLARVPARDP